MCKDCHSFLGDVNKFISRAAVINSMFNEISSLEQSKGYLKSFSTNLAKIRSKYGLDPVTEVHLERLEIKIEKQDIERYVDESEIPENTQETEKIEIKVEVENNEESCDGSENLNLFQTDVNEDIEGDFIDQNELLNQDEDFPEDHEEEQEDEAINFQDNLTFICHVCQEQFTTAGRLQSHCKSIHNCSAQIKCSCGKILRSRHAVYLHNIKHFGNPEVYKYRCDECDRSYKVKSMYDTHMETKHGANAVNYTCKTCSKHFRALSLLKKHEETHLPDHVRRTHTCRFCKKKYLDKNMLKGHIALLHNKSKKKGTIIVCTCELCGKGFASKYSVETHLLGVHSDERNFKCEICSLAFKNSPALRKVISLN